MSKNSVWRTTKGLAILVTARTGVTATGNRAWRADWVAGSGTADEALGVGTDPAVGSSELAARLLEHASTSTSGAPPNAATADEFAGPVSAE